MADNGHYGKRKQGKSRQGIYVFTSEGKFLSSINSLSADRVLMTLQDGILRWKSELASQNVADKNNKPAPAPIPEHRWEDSYPRDGLVLTVYARDLNQSEDERSPFWNRDSAWFSRQECDRLVPTELKVGVRFPLPDFFVHRITRFHLVDAVKGQTESFSIDNVSDSKIEAEVIAKTDRNTELRLFGNSIARVPEGRYTRGVKTELLGSVVLDNNNQIVKFEMIAIGSRWGRTRYNDRRRQLSATPIGYYFELTPRDATPVIPGIIWSYDADWIEQR